MRRCRCERIARRLLCVFGDRSDLDGALRLGALDAELAGGCVDAARLLAGLSMRRKLRRMKSLRDLDPFRDLLIAIELGALA